MNQSGVFSVEHLMLPSMIVTRQDLAHLVQELEAIDSTLTSKEVQVRVGMAAGAPVTATHELAYFLTQNHLTITSGKQCSELVKVMRKLKTAAPTVYLTFAVPAEREHIEQLTEWVRTSLHPQALVEVRLQPALIAGVHVRTPNHVYDLSMRAALTNSRQALVNQLEALRVS